MPGLPGAAFIRATLLGRAAFTLLDERVYRRRVDRDRLFLETLQDLETRSAGRATEYEVLRSAVLLRELLLDESPLVHQVNRDRNMPLMFRVNVSDPIWKIAGTPAPSFWAMQDGFDPDTALTRPQIGELDLPAFLSRVVIVSRGTELTVKDRDSSGRPRPRRCPRGLGSRCQRARAC